MKLSAEKSADPVEDDIPEWPDEPGSDLTHKQILEIFKGMCVNDTVKQWWKKGPEAIRIQLENVPSPLVFKWRNPYEWRLETLKLYEKRNKVR